jgi:luciferase family oxidoreductase group 1
MALRLGVLDQSPIAPGEDASQAVHNTLRLAQACDRLGYHRYWVAEHHASATLAGCSPEILIARLAAETTQIRVGSGGVMLSHYSPFKVAENFRLLELLYPGRIDLGVGRAPGSDGLTAAALAYGNRLGIEYYPTKVRDLRAFVSGTAPWTEAFAELRATPQIDSVPELWMLGSSHDSAHIAAELGIAFSFAHFIAPEHAQSAMQQYRQRFRPEHGAEPRASLCVFVLCSDDPERVELFRRIREIRRIRREQGLRGPIPTLEEARSYAFSAQQLEHMHSGRSRQLVGLPGEVYTDLCALAEACQSDELIVLSITPDFKDRLRCYELLAEVFELSR